MPPLSRERVKVILWAVAIGAVFGLVVYVTILLYGPRMDDWLVFLLCPTCLGGMALDSARGIELDIGVVMLAVTSAAWYAVVFGFMALLFTPE